MKLLCDSWQRFITENKDSKRVAKAVIYIDNKILLLKNNQGWDLPGGHVHVGETMTQGLAREIEEETGLQIDERQVKNPIYRHNHMSVYEVSLEIGTIRLSDEHNQHELIHPDDITNIELPEKFRRAIEKTFK